MKKIRIHSEAAYFAAIILLSLAVALIASTNFGVSMVVAPAYILSLKVSWLTFGQSEYIIQGFLFVIFCIVMKKVKLVYFSSFLTGIIYGAVLDLWRKAVPHLNPSVTAPGALPMPLRIVYFATGMLLTAFSIALLFKTYLYPQVYDFFVKGVSEKTGIDRTRFKLAFDVCCLAVSFVMTLILFGEIRGIGVGTVIMTALNGIIIGLFGKLFDRFFVFEPIFGRFAKHFEIV